jgi:hypothetical protein
MNVFFAGLVLNRRSPTMFRVSSFLRRKPLDFAMPKWFVAPIQAFQAFKLEAKIHQQLGDA